MSSRLRQLRRSLGPATAALIVASLVAGTPRRAHAQSLVERFDPAERGSRFFVADSLELDGDPRLATGVVASYGNKLRTFKQSGSDPEASNLITHSIWIHPGASLVLTPGARVALDVPVALQTGSDVVLDRTTYNRPASPRLGDLRGSFDLRLLGGVRTDADGALLAGGVSVYLPTGSGSDYAGDDVVRFDVRLANTVRVGHFLMATRVGYMYRRDELPAFGGVSLGSEANAVLAAGYRTDSIVVGPELYGSTTVKNAFERRSTPIEALLGAHASASNFRVGAGIGTLLVGGLGAPLLRGVLSLEWVPGGNVKRDRDHDGVLDGDDLCPDIPGPASTDVGARGCPAAPRDTDRDGIFDNDDACPDLPGLRSNDPMTHGCPDADRDGIPDPVDACPKIAGEHSVLPRFNGCPADADGDGILDLQDACPDEPGPATDDTKTNGCPQPIPPPDRDEDGIRDADDACPDDKGIASPDENANGCPMVRAAGDALLLGRPIQVASAPGKRPLVFTPDSEQVLADVATFLVAHPELARVRITGASGTSVLERLVVLGVSRRRLIAGPAKTPRLELTIVK